MVEADRETLLLAFDGEGAFALLRRRGEEWSAVAPAPRAIVAGAPEVLAGRVLFHTPDDSVLSFDPRSDTWTEGEGAPFRVGEWVGYGGQVHALGTR